MSKNRDYHGIIVNISQRDKSIFAQLKILGRKTIIPAILLLYKINVAPEKLESTLQNLQDNMAGSLFYAHLYRNEELIVIFKHKIFRVTPDNSSWQEPISYGRSVHIPGFLLDFTPCRFEDETF